MYVCVAKSFRSELSASTEIVKVGIDRQLASVRFHTAWSVLHFWRVDIPSR